MLIFTPTSLKYILSKSWSQISPRASKLSLLIWCGCHVTQGVISQDICWVLVVFYICLFIYLFWFDGRWRACVRCWTGCFLASFLAKLVLHCVLWDQWSCCGVCVSMCQSDFFFFTSMDFCVCVSRLLSVCLCLCLCVCLGLSFKLDSTTTNQRNFSKTSNTSLKRFTWVPFRFLGYARIS